MTERLAAPSATGWQEVVDRFGVDPRAGLSADEARQRLQQDGPNVLAAAEKESGVWPLLVVLAVLSSFVLALGALLG